MSLLFGHYGGAFASVGEIVVDSLEELLHLDWTVLLAVHFYFFIVNFLALGFWKEKWHVSQPGMNTSPFQTLSGRLSVSP